MSATDYKAKLKAKNLTQVEAARRLSVSKDYLNNVLNGRGKLTKRLQVKLDTLLKII